MHMARQPETRGTIVKRVMTPAERLSLAVSNSLPHELGHRSTYIAMKTLYVTLFRHPTYHTDALSPIAIGFITNTSGG